MTRIDRHVAVVRTKMVTDRFLHALAWSLLVYAGVVWVMILVDRVFHWRPQPWGWWFLGGVAASAAVALVVALVRRPTPEQAAVAIDQRLGLKEKFSTALFVRHDPKLSRDPFAAAAVRDAEVTADKVDLHRKFPLSFPRAAYGTLGVAIVAALTAMLLDPLDLLAKPNAPQKQVSQTRKVEEARKQLADALATVNAVPPAIAQMEQVKLAREALVAQLSKPTTDPAGAKREAIKRLQEVEEAIKQHVKGNQKYAEAKNAEKLFKQMAGQPIDEPGPVNDARRAIARGDFENAINQLQKTVENFDKMDQQEQTQAAEQMKQMAQQLQQMANDPQQQQQMQQQLQQMGMSQQQAQQAQQLMQQAAQGDKAAQQQLQQMAQQAMQQMNNGQGPTPQQQQQIQQMMQQMQGLANAQAQAQQMGQLAQQMAQAMQQASQGQQGQQQMQQAAQGMQSSLEQLQAMQADMQQMQAAQNAAQQAQQQAMNSMNGQGGQAGNGNQNGGGEGQWDGGGDVEGQDQGGEWNGEAGPAGPNQGGIGAGDRTYKSPAPYGTKAEFSPSENQEKGRVLAATLVKAEALKGESKEQLKQVLEASEKHATEEVDQDRVSRQAQKVVREYFGAMQRDVQAAPGTQPAK